MSRKPWVSGPAEILQHGLSLLREDTDKYRRLAMLNIDNSVELMIKTYFSLPKRVTGLNISRKKYEEIKESFPSLLDALEEHCSNMITDVDLGEIEWFHRLRNELYHQGNGLTVELSKVQVYAEMAKMLFLNLFDIKIEVDESDSQSQKLVNQFLVNWNNLERLAQKFVEQSTSNNTEITIHSSNPILNISKYKLLEPALIEELDLLRIFRNEFLHGNSHVETKLLADYVERTNRVYDFIDKKLMFIEYQKMKNE